MCIRDRTDTYRSQRIRVDDAFREYGVGERWHESFVQDSVKWPAADVPPVASSEQHDVTWTLELDGVWVVVPAGRFCAIRLHREDPKGDPNQTYWFAPGVGKVMEHNPPKEHEVLLEYYVAPQGTGVSEP